MIIKSDNFNLTLTCASVVSTIFFCIGFFPLAIVKNVESENPFYESKINRSVLMIIDAFRLDFLASESFSYVHQLIENKQGCLLQLTASLPTVTKPRIKVRISIIHNDNFPLIPISKSHKS